MIRFNKPTIKHGAILFLLLCVSVLSSCDVPKVTETDFETQTEEKETVSYIRITAEQAKQLMDTESDYIILDVRTLEEYNEGHIPGAILIPDFEIVERAPKELVKKEQLILVYCRSGRRSKNASQALADLGYSNIKEFGGIIDWPYEIE